MVVAGIMAGGGAFVGEGAALLAAFLWAAATLLFGRLGQQLSPLVLNLVKGVFAIGFIGITLLIRTELTSPTAGAGLPWMATLYLILSGGIGIGLGDTAYFAAINALGARRALLLETLAPPMTAVLAWVFLSETLPLTAVLGIVLTLLGIAWVISERVPGADVTSQPGGGTTSLGGGLRIALIAVFCQASGAVLSRAALVDVAVDPLWSSLLRLLAGMAFMGGLAVCQPWRLGDYSASGKSAEPESGRPDTAQATPPTLIATKTAAVRKSVRQSTNRQQNWSVRLQKSAIALKNPKFLGVVAVAAFFGTYLGIWLQQIALKYTAAGIAQALLATSPLFVLPMAALLGDRISIRSIFGVAITLTGVWLLIYIG